MEKEYSFEMMKQAIKSFAMCMDDYLYAYDIKEDLYYIDKKALQRFQIPANEFHDVSRTMLQFTYEDDREMLADDLGKMTRGEKEYHNLQYRWISREGEPLWINCRGRLLRNADQTPQFMLGCINEIGKQQKADNVSGLLRESALQHEFAAFEGKYPEGFMLRIGIDDFKDINEKFGTEYGDSVLRFVAGCIEENLEPGQQAFRMIADEFLVLDTKGGTAEQAHELYHRIRASVDRVIEAHRYEAVYTISGGVVLNQDIAQASYEKMNKISQFALSEAKLRGKNQGYIFKQEDYTKFLRKRRILRALRQSVENDFTDFDLYFQPIVNAGTEKLFAAESLLRFQLNGEMISPAEFIPILEESGLIIPVGKWILKTAFSMCQECRKYCPEFKISVNLSYIQILKSPIFDDIMSSIVDEVLQPSSVIVELTESGYLENSPSIQNVWIKLKNQGVNIALDDFGTGYSNLQSIGETMPQIIKIDRGFTVKALTNEYERQLMIHIIKMVHSIGLGICVEGIETEEELETITSLGADYIQGFYYSKPCTREEFMEKFVLEGETA
ncbi:MAG: EAL domain-containing protein [Clostridiaceae bacterium]|nr:EAL domain-containing protein [Clostridiaceae bacterium]